jgi:hypothetical protein
VNEAWTLEEGSKENKKWRGRIFSAEEQRQTRLYNIARVGKEDRGVSIMISSMDYGWRVRER